MLGWGSDLLQYQLTEARRVIKSCVWGQQGASGEQGYVAGGWLVPPLDQQHIPGPKYVHVISKNSVWYTAVLS